MVTILLEYLCALLLFLIVLLKYMFLSIHFANILQDFADKIDQSQ